MALLDELDRRRERREQDRENAARLATASAVFSTDGVGTIQFEERVPFAVTFIEKPAVSYASVVDIDELADQMDIEDETQVPLPMVAGYVTKWDQDERDFYTGCWVAVRSHFLDSDAIAPDVVPTIEHHFTFSAIGMKDIPPDLTDAID